MRATGGASDTTEQAGRVIAHAQTSRSPRVIRPLAPPVHHEPPIEVAPGTHLVREVQHALGQPVSVFINSLVIVGEEPVLVDTGSARNRDRWLEDTFGLVEPDDVRWIFVSHEDPDHVGNLAEVLELCPQATLVSSWALVERSSNAFEFPLPRCRWADDGASFMAGDRRLCVLRPPIYDSPTTRGLFDTSTGVYWASDAFATPVPGGQGASELASELAELDDEFWRDGMVMFGLNAVSPWLELVDPARFALEVARIRSEPITTIVSGHSPVITGPMLQPAWDHLAALAGTKAPPVPDQAVLDLIVAATSLA